ncbi:MAG: ATP phosphoribosyltransferase regulatory subunit, partial [Chloroflexi bacterium]|nr:ATP phosphoribosyltransferase regulatory subunit [Chloroflexota bacterium]
DQPTKRLTDHTTNRPHDQPTTRLTDHTTNRPNDQPTTRLTDHTTNRPHDQPTTRPTDQPTNRPNDQPTNRPNDQTMSPIFNLPNSSNPPAIPRGVADFFGAAAVVRREAETALRDLARGWAYVEVIPPTFEYAETLAAEAGDQLAEELYRFLDRDGRALALRPDLTIPTARMAGSKLYDQPLPQRFFYVGPAFRYEEPQAGRQREFWQAGIELIGARSNDADAEVLAFAAQSLKTLAIPEYRFTLGHLGYFRGLVEHLKLEPGDLRELQAVLDRKSYGNLAALLARLKLDVEDRRTLTGLLDLSDTRSADALVRADALARNQKMADAVAGLREVIIRLNHYGVLDQFDIDLADVRGMDYYTGITFKAYTPHMGFSIVNGGRYDNLVGHFGPSRPAVGCAFYLDRILLARQRQSGADAEPASDLLISACECGDYAQLAQQARDQGLVVAMALGPEPANATTPIIKCNCDDSITLISANNQMILPASSWLQTIIDRFTLK